MQAASYKQRKHFDLARGFTLVELLVVIAIIGVLATLLLLQLNTARQKARDAKRVSDVSQVAMALELFNEDAGSYPVSTTVDTAYSGVKLSSYLTKIPDDPSRTCTAGVYNGTGGCYGYAWDPVGTKAVHYHLWTELEQKAKGALDSDADFNSMISFAPGWTSIGGAGQNGALETCTSSTAVDCVYDQGTVK